MTVFPLQINNGAKIMMVEVEPKMYRTFTLSSHNRSCPWSQKTHFDDEVNILVIKFFHFRSVRNYAAA